MTFEGLEHSSHECDHCNIPFEGEPVRFDGPTIKGIDWTFCSILCREAFRED